MVPPKRKPAPAKARTRGARKVGVARSARARDGAVPGRGIPVAVRGVAVPSPGLGDGPASLAEIRALGAELDRLLDERLRCDITDASRPDDDDDLEITRDALPEAAPADRRPMAKTEEAVDLAPASLERLTPPATRSDPFGFDRAYDEMARGVLEFFYTRYFRVKTRGIENIPARGPCLLVAHRDEKSPFDGLMIKTAVKLEHRAPRDVRWLTDDLPYVGGLMNRLGAVRTSTANAELLLGSGEILVLFPGRSIDTETVVRACLRTKAPIVPVVVDASPAPHPLLLRLEGLSRALGLAKVPAPTKLEIRFGEPIAGEERTAADLAAHAFDAIAAMTS